MAVRSVLRRALYTPQPQPVADVASIAAPIGGWNARDPLGAMDPLDAVQMENWFPATNSVNLRSGYQPWMVGFPDQVETLMVYAGGATTELFAVSDGDIFDATLGSLTSPPTAGVAVVSGLSNSRLQYINVTTAGGSFLLAVNGADKLQGYDGSNWYEDGDGSHDITGVNTNTINQINLFKNRVWLIPSTGLKAWYLGLNAISGAAAAWDLSAIATLGGNLVAMGTWTIDAGQGADDYAAFITDMGEIIVYKGTDPTSATTFALAGVWQIGTPVGARCFLKFAGDLLLITQDGIYPMSGALQSSRVQPQVALSFKIQYAVSQAVDTYAGNFGWELFYYPGQNQLWVNVPISASERQQYVMNTITKSWCKFTGWDFNCFELLNDSAYAGGDTIVAVAWSSNADNGIAINANCLQAFSYYGARGQQKRFTMMRPIFLTNGSPAIYSGLNIDYDLTEPTATLAVAPATYASWDSSVWDSGEWGAGLLPQKYWQGATGIGFSAAPRLVTQSNGLEVQWMSTDIVMERGGVL